MTNIDDANRQARNMSRLINNALPSEYSIRQIEIGFLPEEDNLCSSCVSIVRSGYIGHSSASTNTANIIVTLRDPISTEVSGDDYKIKEVARTILSEYSSGLMYMTMLTDRAAHEG